MVSLLTCEIEQKTPTQGSKFERTAKHYHCLDVDECASQPTFDVVRLIFEGADSDLLNQRFWESEFSKLVASSPCAEGGRLKAAYILGTRTARSYEKHDELSTPLAVYSYCEKYIGCVDKEHFLLLCLNTKNEVLSCDTLSIGTLDKAIVGIRDVFKRALLMSARSIILAHNHPSGDPHPSASDIELTRRIRRAGALFDIEVLDHVVLGSEGRLYSLRSCGDM